MNPMNVLRMAKAMNGATKRILLVGCEPESLGGEEGHMGLSEPCEAALEQAVAEIELLISKMMEKQKPIANQSAGEEEEHVSKHV
jgi:hydrogenase maturation protease